MTTAAKTTTTRKAPAPAPVKGAAPVVQAAKSLNFAKEVSKWTSEQCFTAFEENQLKNEVIADRLRVLHPEKGAAMRAYKEHLLKQWPAFEVNGKGTEVGGPLHTPQKRYMSLYYYFRTDSGGRSNKGKPRDLEAVISSFVASARKKAADCEWCGAFVTALRAEEKTALKKLLK